MISYPSATHRKVSRLKIQHNYYHLRTLIPGRIIFAIFVNNVSLSSISEILEINNDLGEIATVIYELN